MNLGAVEDQVLPVLKRALRGAAPVFAGPPVAGPATGLKPEVFVHAAAYEDFGGVTADGARITRSPARVPPSFRGYSEQRPGRIVLQVSWSSPSYELLRKLGGIISPPVLVALETLSPPILAMQPNEAVQMVFADHRASLFACSTQRRTEDSADYYLGRMEFHVDGFLHVTVTRRGGLRRDKEPTPGGRPRRPSGRVP